MGICIYSLFFSYQYILVDTLPVSETQSLGYEYTLDETTVRSTHVHALVYIV